MAGITSETEYALGPNGVYLPARPVSHREDEYDPHAFEQLRRMQELHFWYAGRHRFILRSVRRELRSTVGKAQRPRAIDLGGGCGGWIKYLKENAPDRFAELALGDSSIRGLQLAESVVGADVRRYQIDLLDLYWHDRWDIAFLLDVLEHIPDDAKALEQIRAALRPGGLLFVATPALNCFWSYNDELVHHVRRYSRGDFRRLAEQAGLQYCYSRYFMFFLSPLLLLSRLKRPNIKAMTTDQIRDHLGRTHRVPVGAINGALGWVFAAETPLGHWLPFPWGTSILGVFRKP
jgi:SAM-dependent methyltransferase